MIEHLLERKPESWDELIDGITPAIHAQLKTAVELGKWPNGERLNPEQTALCLQAVIAWEQKHLSEEQRVGWIDRRRLKTTHCDDA